MLHPAFAQELATAHIEDLHRAAARRRVIRFAGRVAQEPHRIRVGATRRIRHGQITLLDIPQRSQAQD